MKHGTPHGCTLTPVLNATVHFLIGYSNRFRAHFCLEQIFAFVRLLRRFSEIYRLDIEMSGIAYALNDTGAVIFRISLLITLLECDSSEMYSFLLWDEYISKTIHAHTYKFFVRMHIMSSL